jgi:DNA-damage-inducible protein D
MDNQIAVFEQKKIRQTEHNGETYFSVIDIIEALTDSKNPNRYWTDLKRRSEKESGQSYAFCVSLKLQGSDGKFYKTDCANTEGVFRIIQSVPSPKAEPFKMWLAALGKRELEEVADPELGFERLREIYQAKGYSEDWIKQRLQSINTRKQLTDEWKKRGVKEGQEYSILTAMIAKGTFGLTPSEHKNLKGLNKENLRDHMSDLELIFTALGEAATKIYAEDADAQGFEENHDAASKGGKAAGNARITFEKDTKRQVISPTNFLKDTDDIKKID